MNMACDTPEAQPRAQRRRVLKGAKIVFNTRQSAIDCVVRNLSETGVRLRVDGALSVPDEFDLLIDTGERYACRVVRRKMNELGVAFRT